MKKLLLTIGLISAALGAVCLGVRAKAAEDPAAAKPAPAAVSPVKASSPRVQVVTSLGNFTIELNDERAPLTVASFLKYVDQGQYTRTIFHRAIPNFVIQGGGFDTDLKSKSAPTKTFNESGNGLTNMRGTVGLARGSEPHSGDCQFYVNLNDNSALDPPKRAGATRYSAKSSTAWMSWTASRTRPPAPKVRSRRTRLFSW